MDQIRPTFDRLYKNRVPLHSITNPSKSLITTKFVRLVCLLVMGLSTYSCAPTSSDRTVLGLTTTTLNLRNAPNLSGAIVHVFAEGDPLEILGQVGSWYWVHAGNLVGYVAARYSELTTDQSPVLQTHGPLNLHPEYADALREVSPEWLAYVQSHIDRIVYVPYHEFQSDGQSVLGTAQLVNRERLVHVATGGWDADDVAAVLVHEAAHLEDATRGIIHDDDYASSVENRFKRELEESDPQDARSPGATDAGPEQPFFGKVQRWMLQSNGKDAEPTIRRPFWRQPAFVH